MANVAVVGATGAVGAEFLKLFTQRNFPIDELRLLATERSSGRVIRWAERGAGDDANSSSGEGHSAIGRNNSAMGKIREIEVQQTSEDSFAGMDFVFFAGGSASTEFVPAAVRSGAIVIDNSSAYRMDPAVPLVVPEINPDDVKWHKGVIANPNCSTIIMVMALKAIEDAVGIDRIVVSTYQAVSGAGHAGQSEMEEQIKAWVQGKDVDTAYKESQNDGQAIFPYPIAFNLIPHIDRFCEGGFSNEELKMVRETQKIFHRPDLRISATTVRVPVWRSHSESINVETITKMSADEARAAMLGFPGVVVQDNLMENLYPMPLYTANTDEVYVGRIREDTSVERGLCLWAVGDQLRKGAATNAVQIAELLL
ncbi:MAG: aspartate-semialdehyde dehydrogenase [Peptococcaceae bacterium]|nr:aspartate-semialdehyde dehydrogenase [Peptococcaceae bacterium]